MQTKNIALMNKRNPVTAMYLCITPFIFSPPFPCKNNANKNFISGTLLIYLFIFLNILHGDKIEKGPKKKNKNLRNRKYVRSTN